MCVALLLSRVSAAEGWRGIKPLHSTREDVERLLGSPTRPGGFVYKLESETVFVEYQILPCDEGSSDGWKVPLNTVIGISVRSRAKPQFTDLEVDKTKYEKVESKQPTIFYYVNKEEGITYEVDGGIVTSVHYGPAASDSHLRCPAATSKKSCGSNQKK